MLSNLPPGCSEGDLPGNRPEDIAWDKFYESLDFEDLDVEEAEMAVKIGIAGVKATRELNRAIIDRTIADDRMMQATESPRDYSLLIPELLDMIVLLRDSLAKMDTMPILQENASDLIVRTMEVNK